MSSRILIVEDEANVRLNYRITLETEGYEVVEAATAASALLLLIEQSFAVAILDMRLPGMDGLELLAKMREMEIMVPAMIVTAYSDVPHGESDETGCHRLFTKTSPTRRSSSDRCRDSETPRARKRTRGRKF
jgi:DNA-binding NtrC family response regulator